MSYKAHIHPAFDDDIVQIVVWLRKSSPATAHNFVNVAYDEIDIVLDELDNNVFHQNKRPVKSRAPLVNSRITLSSIPSIKTRNQLWYWR